MPTPFNVTIDDVSPLISYDPPGYWTQNSSVDAYGGSYTSTFYPNASASFEFDGTSITVTGSKGSWHGTYSVSLDGYIKAFNGSAKSDSFKAIIFSSGTLMEGHHSLQIMNTDPTWLNLDIDSITWTCVLGNDSVSTSPLQSTTVDDSDPAFSYLPHGGWDLNPSNIASFSNKTGHSISLPQASVNLTFSSTGDAVSIYGTTGPGNSPYSIQRAGEPPKELSATRTMNSSQVLLYFGSDFGPGNHTVTMVNEAHGLFQIDYAVVHAVDFSSLPSSRYIRRFSSSPNVRLSSPLVPQAPLLQALRLQLLSLSQALHLTPRFRKTRAIYPIRTL
ncbi:hypothetical protein B0H11DRAFT_1718206 [Mycena galericulata]|nr:hypothetical protein B0H11DRAFT_1718206 [Mycena galericulata]